jgi:hypothetical protein
MDTPEQVIGVLEAENKAFKRGLAIKAAKIDELKEELEKRDTLLPLVRELQGTLACEVNLAECGRCYQCELWRKVEEALELDNVTES